MTEGTIERTVTFEAIAKLMATLEEVAESTSEETHKFDIFSIMENILTAETPEELWERQEAGGISSKDYINQPFQLLADNLTWRRSQLQGSSTTFPFYAMLRVHDMATDTEKIINGGGFSFVSVLSKLQEWNMLTDEYTYQLVEKQTSNGYNVVLIKPVAGPKPSNGSAKRAANAKS